jgi:alpha-glucosidase (family GH31 glycosyl hydrolase)
MLLVMPSSILKQGTSPMQPMAQETIWQPDSWAYKMGKDIFVNPIVENSTKVSVTFPPGDEWVNWWTNETYSGGSTMKFDIPLSRFPAYKRKGSIIPLNVDHFASSHGGKSSSDAITLLIHPTKKIAFETVNIYEWKGSGMIASYEYNHQKNNFTLIATAYSKPLIVLMRGISISESTVIYNKVAAEKLTQIVGDKDKCLEQLQLQQSGFCKGDLSLGEIFIRPGPSHVNGTILELIDIDVY